MSALLALAFLTQQAPVFTQAQVSGIVVTEFTVPEGWIQVYLPQDMSAGDTVSGTVLVQPKGTGDAKDANEKLLRGVVIAIDENVAEVRGQRFVIRGLDKSHRLNRSLKTRVYADGPFVEAPVVVDEERTDVTLDFVIPEVSSSGRPMQIVGSFDGDTSTTKVSVGGKDATVFVETPRSCIVQADTSFVGKKSVTVSDLGKTREGSVFLPKIELSAAKTTLARGEKTTLTVTVQGLDGAPASLYPIPIELKNLTPEVIDMATYVNYGVEASEVRDGVWTKTFPITSVNAGSFVVSGLLFGVSLHDAKRAMSPRQFRDWCKALIVVYEQKIKELEPRRNEAGIAQNIQIKRNLLRVLEAGSRATTEGEKSTLAIAVDKELATQSFFSVASDLVSIAADFLGYTSIPMPNVGTLLKGIAVLARGSQRAVDAVKKAQDIYDALAKMQEGQAKVEKAKELKEALDKVREAVR